MKLELRMGDWMVTMGLVGLYRVFEYGLRNGVIDQRYRQSVLVLPQGLEVETDVLPQLPRAYFLYLIDEYSAAKRESERLLFYMEQAKRENLFSTASSNIKKVITDIGKRIQKYFPNEPVEPLFEKLKSIKKPTQWDQLQECVSDFQKMIRKEAINEKLTLNYFKAAILKSFFGQVSFLNVSKNYLDLEGHIEQFQTDYIGPVQYDLQLEYTLQSASKVDEILSFLDQHVDYGPFKALKKAWKKKTLSQVREEAKRLAECMLFPGHFAFYNFEEMVFSPIGLSKGNALNFNWNLQDKQPKPISSLAKLVLFFAPAGAAIYSKREQSYDQGEYRTYAGFVQSDAAFPEILQKNNHFKQMKQQKDPFDHIVSKLVQSITTEARYVIDHLFFLEFSSDYDSKKTHLHYYHLPLYLARYFVEYPGKLDYVHYEYREQFIQEVLRGVDPAQAIYRYLRDCIENGRSHIGPYIAVRERNRIMQLKKGVKGMEKTDKRVYALYRSGQEIRKTVEQAGAPKAAGHYSASPSKKISSIAYRLLNAAKAGDRKSFLDTLFRLHMSAERPISPLFLNALHERDLDFTTVANAFIAGLLSQEGQGEQEEVVS
ncbi:type I-B CRISPR-associated protein Cas8b1/Cst1 [Geobacillus sp. 46C-IIa]|uniref:type I-B CRISPR-associated protein Cas8b1/Cst1 n=1 Tax=Geobacillus sp. 46C-IIa TaxID=1963025 RepID=UPI0009BCFD09|nr:type I-B CRISPR-associated protein Cas8b1/Cst1 [Geobacillus sp. 46C-IIa]OQP05481.1 type I-B CRISPR-associated protein Cas8b1/Cst1 [Geobacillus sp. 46C-IIa]QNU29159.1 type I-B CRISPR-associated protein Cas8b1/Cst1 [Geobacillus sp. 46C-IIa]